MIVITSTVVPGTPLALSGTNEVLHFSSIQKDSNVESFHIYVQCNQRRYLGQLPRGRNRVYPLQVLQLR